MPLVISMSICERGETQCPWKEWASLCNRRCTDIRTTVKCCNLCFDTLQWGKYKSKRCLFAGTLSFIIIMDLNWSNRRDWPLIFPFLLNPLSKYMCVRVCVCVCVQSKGSYFHTICPEQKKILTTSLPTTARFHSVSWSLLSSPLWMFLNHTLIDTLIFLTLKDFFDTLILDFAPLPLQGCLLYWERRCREFYSDLENRIWWSSLRLRNRHQDDIFSVSLVNSFKFWSS